MLGESLKELVGKENYKANNMTQVAGRVGQGGHRAGQANDGLKTLERPDKQDPSPPTVGLC